MILKGTNKVRSVRRAQRFASDTSRRTKKAMAAEKGRRNKRRAFFSTILSPRLPSVNLYKGKSQDLEEGVKVGVEVEYSGGNKAILDDIWFKIPTFVWEKRMSPARPDDEEGPPVPPRYVNAPIGHKQRKKKIDTYSLQDITALCLHLRSSLAEVGEMMIEEEDDDNMVSSMKTQASKIRSWLNAIDEHQKILQDGEDDEYYETSAKVNAAIRYAHNMEPIEAFFKKRRIKKFQKTLKGETIDELIAGGEEYIKRLDSKGVGATILDIVKMARGKAKIRLEAYINALKQKRAGRAGSKLTEGELTKITEFIQKGRAQLGRGRKITPKDDGD